MFSRCTEETVQVSMTSFPGQAGPSPGWMTCNVVVSAAVCVKGIKN